MTMRPCPALCLPPGVSIRTHHSRTTAKQCNRHHHEVNENDSKEYHGTNRGQAMQWTSSRSR
eukprot:6219333-Amphidinium_carterae.1